MREFEECLVFAENGLCVQGMEGERGMNKQRLIDANALVQRIYNAGLWDDSMEAAIRWIDSAPTVPAVVLPCEIGETVYAKHMECDTPYLPDNCTDWRTARDVELGSSCEECPHRHPVAIEKKFDYSDIPKFGKTVFLTREEAEAALRRAEE